MLGEGFWSLDVLLERGLAQQMRRREDIDEETWCGVQEEVAGLRDPPRVRWPRRTIEDSMQEQKFLERPDRSVRPRGPLPAVSPKDSPFDSVLLACPGPWRSETRRTWSEGSELKSRVPRSAKALLARHWPLADTPAEPQSPGSLQIRRASRGRHVQAAALASAAGPACFYATSDLLHID